MGRVVVPWLLLLAACGKPAEPQAPPAAAPTPGEGTHESGPTPAFQGGLLSEVVAGTVSQRLHATPLRIISGTPLLDGRPDHGRTVWTTESVLAASAAEPARLVLGSEIVASLEPNTVLARVPWLPRSFCLLDGSVGVTVPPGTVRIDTPVRFSVPGGSALFASSAFAVISRTAEDRKTSITVRSGSLSLDGGQRRARAPETGAVELHAGEPGTMVGPDSTDQARRVAFEVEAREAEAISRRLSAAAAPSVTPPAPGGAPNAMHDLIALTLERRVALARLLVAWEQYYCGAVAGERRGNRASRRDAAPVDLASIEASAQGVSELLALGAGTP